MRSLARMILRHSRGIVLCGLLLTLPCLYWTKLLYGNLKPDIEELLPRQSRSILDLGEIRSRLKAIDNLGILILSDDAAAAKRFSVDLATRLEKLPPSVVAGIEYRIDQELRFFERRKALFVDVSDLERIRDFIRARIEYEKALYNPLNIFSEIDLPEPQLDFPALLNKYSAKSASFDHFPEGFYATPDGKKRVVLAYMPASGITGAFKLKEAVETAVRELQPARYSSSLRVAYTGGVEDTLEEYTALVADIEKSAEIVFAFVTLFLWLYFRSWIAVGCLLGSLFMARFWTFGVTWFLVGSLNANSAFMGSLLLGSGITFGVITLSRYLEERRSGRKPVRAARISIQRTARATWTAALAAGAAYGSLFLTEFEGFRQYGKIGLIGMILCWLSSILVLPSLLVQVEKIRPLVRAKGFHRKPWIFGPLASGIERFPGTMVLISLLVTVISLAGFSRFNAGRIIETDLTRLRNKESMTQGSGFLSRHLDEIFQRFLTPLAILTPTQEGAEKVAARLKQLQEEAEAKRLISSVSTIQQFIPTDQPRKIRVLRQIEKELPPRIFHRLPAADQARVRSFLTPEALQPFGQADLPRLIVDKFTEKDGSIGKLVLVEPPLESARWSGHQLNTMAATLRAAGPAVGVSPTPVAGGLLVVSDMIEAISKDGPKATLVAFLAVVALVVLLFRQRRIIAMILSALLLGNLWLFGFILWNDFKINFLNFIAFPITFGIGADYSVNIFHRLVGERKGSIVQVVRETGGAVGLCSLTTITGYSSLLLARNQAFVSFGTLAVIGELTTVITAVISLPALIVLISRWRQRPSFR